MSFPDPSYTYKSSRTSFVQPNLYSNETCTTVCARYLLSSLSHCSILLVSFSFIKNSQLIFKAKFWLVKHHQKQTEVLAKYNKTNDTFTIRTRIKMSTLNSVTSEAGKGRLKQ